MSREQCGKKPILKSYLGINLDIDKTRKQVDGDRKCVINYSMTFSDILLDIFDKIKVEIKVNEIKVNESIKS